MPGTVVDKGGPSSYRIKMKNNSEVVNRHIDQLVRFDPQTTNTPDEELATEVQEDTNQDKGTDTQMEDTNNENEQVKQSCPEEVNPEKSAAMFFSPGTLRSPKRASLRLKTISLYDQQIPWAKYTKYLGVTLDRNLRFNEHITIMIKYGGTCVRDAFLSLCNLCWRTGKVPKDWRRAVIVPLYKGKGSRMECASYRAISLISTASKVYAKIIEKRMRVVSDGLLWDAQGGFRNGRGCMDQVFSLRNIVEKQLAMGRQVFCGFVDLEKAFDRVVRKDLWDILPGYGINGQLMRAVQSTYEGCMACVRVEGSLSPWFDVNIGVRQGCVLSALLFILYLDDCLQRIRLMDVGVRMSDLVVSTLLYVDDAVLLAESPSELQTLVTMMKDDCRVQGVGHRRHTGHAKSGIRGLEAR
ncbi:hypothetical protein K1T71_015198 [Dendrolimus kikuchii]|nr:hypothetical protein K1T71_015198 [Dendrolimus kikuchii]